MIVAVLDQNNVAINYDAQRGHLQAVCPTDGQLIYYDGGRWNCRECKTGYPGDSKVMGRANYYHLVEGDKRYSVEGWLARWWNIDESEISVRIEL